MYVGSAESQKYDQVLDEVFVGPVSPGQYRFVFQANPPDFSKIPSDDIVGVTIILLTCSYRGQEFIRVGYYVNNEYADEALREDPPSEPDIDNLWRNILADKPRVTKFSIEWESMKKENSTPIEDAQQQNALATEPHQSQDHYITGHLADIGIADEDGDTAMMSQ